MAKKSFWKDTKLGLSITSFLIAIILVVAALIALVTWLRQTTQHGIEIQVPKVTELFAAEAQLTLEASGLKMEVIDSTYSSKTPLGTIVEQIPAAGSMVKAGRTIYVIQNAQFRRPVILPELHDISLRQAEVTLASLGLEVEEIVYEPSLYKDLVLDVRQDTTSLIAGTQLQEGEKVTLVVGRGQGQEKVKVPNVTGRSLSSARSRLLSHSLTVGVVQYDIPPTSENKKQYVVYSQIPAAGTEVVEGSNVNLKLSIDLEKTITADNAEGEEDFF